MTTGGVTIDLFKWIIGLMIMVLGIAFGFQQNQIAKIDGRVEAYQNSVYPKLNDINVNLASMSKDIDWIKKTLGEAEVK